MAYQGTDKQFPRATVELHACRLFKTKKLCATASLVDDYIAKIEAFAPPANTPAYSKTDTAFTDLFSGQFDSAAGRTSIRPKDSNCKQARAAATHGARTLRPPRPPCPPRPPRPPPTRVRGPRHPPPAACAQYVIYAKESDDQPATINLLYAFAFDKALHFAANSTIKYKVTLTCDGTTRVAGTMDLAAFNAGTSTFSLTEEVQVSQVREKVLGLGLGLG